MPENRSAVAESTLNNRFLTFLSSLSMMESNPRSLRSDSFHNGNRCCLRQGDRSCQAVAHLTDAGAVGVYHEDFYGVVVAGFVEVCSQLLTGLAVVLQDEDAFRRRAIHQLEHNILGACNRDCSRGRCHG